MKKVFVLFVCTILSVSASTLRGKDREKDPYLTRTFPASSIKEIEVSTSGGSISVSGDASSEAKVDIFVTRDKWTDEKIKKAFEENYTLDVKVEGGKLHVIAERKKGIKNSDGSLSISFKISVPKKIDSHLQTSGGSISINGLSGSQDFQTSGGSLSVENLSGKISGRTSGGSIRISGSQDDINLATSGGSVTATDCTGKIVLATSGGSLNLNNLSGTIEAATSGGSVKATGINGTLKTGTSGGSMNLNEISGNLEAGTSGGSMNVDMKSVNEYVKLSNSGNINLNLPEGKGYNLKIKAEKIETSGLKNFTGKTETKSMEGTTGNGKTIVEIKSSQRVELSIK